jgi:hypothetical protein
MTTLLLYSHSLVRLWRLSPPGPAHAVQPRQCPEAEGVAGVPAAHHLMPGHEHQDLQQQQQQQ